MRISALRVFSYRNFNDETLLFSPATNLLFGLNGQGKTNLLEAIYFLGYAKSFRTSTSKDCIRHGEDQCGIEGQIEHGSLQRGLKVLISRTEKTLVLHGKAVPLDQFIGTFHVVAFTSRHLDVVRGGPGERRNFLDRAMITIFPAHLRHLADYARALRQRNKLLSARHGHTRLDESLLRSWDVKLSQDGIRILSNRIQYLKEMKEEIPRGIFGEEDLEIAYVSTAALGTSDLQEMEAEFQQRLLENRELDKRNGHTSIGPHRDDLQLLLNGKSLGEFGSAGQQRSSLITLYFAQMEIHRRHHDFYPVFLMDDVEAELDRERLERFLSYLSNRTQTFLTTAKAASLPELGSEAARFEIRQGSARRL